MPTPIERSYTAAKVEKRERDGKPVLEGYAAVYNSRSHNLGGFVEQIAPGAFDDALASDPDVLCRVQHEDGLHVIGRTKSGTLQLTSDDHGLKYTCYPPDTQAGRDIVTLVERGDIDQSSFAFSMDDPVLSERWDFEQDPPVRTLLKVNIHDVAPVSTAAYPEATVGLRAHVLDRARETLQRTVDATRARVEKARARASEVRRMRAERLRLQSAREKSRRR